MAVQTPQGSIAQRLASPVAQYSSGGYSLASDLARLQAVRDLQATEATIFYAARILEVLSSAAVQMIGLTPSASAFSNLETLFQFDLAPSATQYWANGLRRLGNDVRHILRAAQSQDADLAALFAERWIDWFFCHFRFGPKLTGLTSDGGPLLAGGDPRLPALLRSIDAEDFDPAAWLAPRQTGGEQPPFMVAATVAAVFANLLLDRGDCDQAFAVLEQALAQFPDDLRLQQLIVLAWKRRGDLDKAVQHAAPLVARSRDDDETAGIVAGVYKQVYLDRGQDTDMLLKSHRAYLAGWEGSKNSNVYLGINAAATALWLGRAADSRRLAGEVRQLLLNRVAALAKAGDPQMLAASYWDQVTLAEAELLLGELAAARLRYQSAFKQSAQSKGNIKVASEQAQRHLPLLGLSLSGKEFFKLEQPSPGGQLVIGVTGHRTLSDEEAIRSTIAQTIGRLAAGKPNILLLSALAAGADCLVAEAVLDEHHGRVRAVLPLEVSDYRRDFTPGQLARFQSLLNRADAIVFPPTLPQSKPPQGKGPPAATSPTVAALDDRQAAYERTGMFIVDHCDVLVAVWDGQPARGRGGTADIVAYARQAARPIAWIKSQAPFELLLEGPAIDAAPRAK
ncbi:MAG: tetratricopeptide repeat protein [Tepidisphaeraceae bacterium]|jgi:tetratricopeptide (TPR) repeat protein